MTTKKQKRCKVLKENNRILKQKALLFVHSEKEHIYSLS